MQHVGHLQADVAAAEDDGPPRTGGHRGADRGAVGEPVDPVHAVGVEPRHVGAQRRPAGGDDEVVVAEGRPAARGDGAGVEVDRLGAGADADLDVLRLELGRRAGDELVAVLDLAADPVGDAAGGVGDVRALLEDDDLQLARVAQPPGLRGRGHAGGVPADDDEPVSGHGRQRVILRGRSAPRAAQVVHRLGGGGELGAGLADRPAPVARSTASAVQPSPSSPERCTSRVAPSCSTRQRCAGLPTSCRRCAPSASATNDPHRPGDTGQARREPGDRGQVPPPGGTPCRG